MDLSGISQAANGQNSHWYNNAGAILGMVVAGLGLTWKIIQAITKVINFVKRVDSLEEAIKYDVISRDNIKDMIIESRVNTVRDIERLDTKISAAHKRIDEHLENSR